MVADQALDGQSRLFHDALHDRIGFRMNARSIERIGRIGNAQKTRSLFKSLGTEARHVQKCAALREGTVFLTPAHN